MYLLVIVVNEYTNVNKILEKFLEIDIRGATIIESRGMGRILSKELPAFSSLRKLFSNFENEVENHTIFSVIRTDQTLQKAIEEINKIIDFKSPGSGIMFTIPIITVFGLAPAIDNCENNDR